MEGDGLQGESHGSIGGGQIALLRMEAGVLAELRTLETNVLQHLESAAPPPPHSSLLFNNVKLAITNRLAASHARILAWLGDLNNCLGIGPPSLQAPPTPSLPTAPEEVAPARPTTTTTTRRKVYFVC